MWQFNDLFFLPGDKITTSIQQFHEIHTKTEKPIFVKNYRFPEVHKKEVERQVNDMLSQQIIQPSYSPWNAPIWIVPKKLDSSGKQKWRIVIDYRKLNEITIDDKYPIPNIEEILDHLGQTKIFTTLDLASGFHQISVAVEHRQKTAFSTHQGHFEFLKMPFGLKNAPATFQRIINQTLSGLIGTESFVYLDDIVIYSTDFSSHLQKLKTVFSRLRENKLLIQPDKSEFAKTEITYLGHIISDKGIQPNPNKIEVIKNFPILTNVKDIQKFLGMTGYYRRFIPNYSEISKPLTQLLKKGINFKWTEECDKSFKTLISLLIQKLILQYPDFNKPFFLNTDASNFTIGAVLSQKKPNSDTLFPISYASRTLNKAELNYSTIEKELLAIIWAVKHFRPYLFGHKFVILSDHKPLQWLFNVNDPGSRLLRWRLKLAEFDYTIQHISGNKNVVADTLSRIYYIQTRSQTKKLKFSKFSERSPKETRNIAIFTSSDIMHKNFLLSTLTPTISEKGDIEVLSTHNHTIFIILYRSNSKETFSQSNFLSLLRKLKIELDKYKITEIGIFDDVNTINDLQKEITEPKMAEILHPILPYWIKIGTIPEDIDKLIKKYHEHPLTGHQGVEKTYKTLLDQDFYWIGMKRSIKNFIRTCQDCQLVKPYLHPTRPPMVITDTSETPSNKVAIDIVGPLPLTENGSRFIFTLQDNLTKFIFAKALPRHTTADIVLTLLEFFAYFGIPQNLLSDNGSDFCSELAEQLYNKFKIHHIRCTPYHPEANGSLERTHGLLKRYFQFYADELQEEWDRLLPLSIFSYNTSVHSSTGFSPYVLMFGRKPYLPIDGPKKKTYEHYLFQTQNTMRLLHENAYAKQQERKWYTKKRCDKRIIPPHFQRGDQVLLRKPNSKPMGPYVITEINLPNIEIDVNGKLKPYHSKLLQPFFITLLFFLSLLGLAFPASEPAIITPIEQNSGIFFQNLVVLYNHIDDWNLVTYFNLSQIEVKLQTLTLLENSIHRYKRSYNQSRLSATLQNNTNSIYHDFRTLRNTVENTHVRREASHRRKHGIFNGGSHVLKWLFGTPSSEDAEYYSTTLQHLTKDDSKQDYLMTHQIQLINNTMNNFATNYEIFQKNQNNIQDTLVLLQNNLLNTSRAVAELQLFTHLQVLFTHFDQIFLRTSTEIHTLQNAILYAKRDIIHPAILTPHHLKEVLTYARVPADRAFPLTH